jgi:hypothetical protein
MLMMKRSVITGVVVIAALVAGFIFLLRGCLAAYDERSAQPPVLCFEKDGKAVIAAIVKYESVTSYKSNGGSTSKTVSTTYYLQINDAVTGQKINSKKVKDYDDVKNFPIAMLGKGNGNAWLFLGEPMAFNPFTLEKIADKKIIEERNPSLKGKMPEQANFYQYNTVTDELLITATDGLKYSLSTTTLLATPVDDDDIAQSPLQAKIKDFQKQQKYYADLDESYNDKFRVFNKLYMDKQISYSTYLDSTKYFNRQNDKIATIIDSLNAAIHDIEALKHMDDDRLRSIDHLTGTNKSYSSICSDADTMNGKWYGLKAAADLENFYPHFEHRNPTTETARNKFYTATIAIKDPGKKAIELVAGEPEKVNDAIFLQGGFLLDKETALPIHLKDGDGFIVCYKEKVGYEGNIILARIDLQGNVKWTVNTNANKLADWTYTGRSLIVLTTDNKELSSGDANVLSIINSQTGQVTVYDYFTDKMRVPKK